MRKTTNRKEQIRTIFQITGAESFNEKLEDKLLKYAIFYTLKEGQVLINR